jgi:hypothetical protein
MDLAILVIGMFHVKWQIHLCLAWRMVWSISLHIYSISKIPCRVIHLWILAVLFLPILKHICFRFWSSISFYWRNNLTNESQIEVLQLVHEWFVSSWWNHLLCNASNQILNCESAVRTQVSIELGQVRMAILSMDPGIHRYSAQRTRIWRVDYAHEFHRMDIR